ncbi:HEAT repeat protein [Paenibacillus shirakamiensis]|uniref:HEAT repeat protein n=1 Tax=Paenibacillus shirakamiensis TaxID=1265935 RepID=A0ABS4JCE7_9BACL|nr:HEAT repeat domain-containing protein [Paenibacillus shirakamiensis]MBP1999378.1 HEAT repeat protein [Paenibacillus shirakamiensis]
MFSHVTVAIYFVYVCLGLIGLGIALLFYMKLKHLSTLKKTEYYQRKHQDYFKYLQTQLYEDQELPLPPGKLVPLEKRIIQDKLMEWIEQFKGEVRTRVIELCYKAGFVDDEMEKLDSLYFSRRVEASYRLGMMRATEATPRLLDMLRKQRYSPVTTIIGRAVSKTADQESQLMEMLGYMLKHGKSIHNLAADVLLETRLDSSKILLQLLDHENPDFVKVALVAMWGQAVPEVIPALNRLSVDADEQDVRAEAVKLYLSSNPVLRDDTIKQLMSDSNWEVRAAVAKSLGNMHAAGSIPLLRRAMQDENWWVRNNSAESLAQLGETGFELLCETAQRGSGLERETALFHIEKVMSEGSDHRALDQMVTFNKKRLIYDRYFGVIETSKPVRKVAAVGGDYSA